MSNTARVVPLAFVASIAISVPACDSRDVNVADFAVMELTASDLKASPTNAFADDPDAAMLGRVLFFDRGLSSDGSVACVDCHDPTHGFSDPRPRSIGVRGQHGVRHAMPITAAVLHPFLLWDGRADSAWSQPLKAIENPKEMDFSRVQVARYVSNKHRAEYESIFGPLPDLVMAPERAAPGDALWTAMPDSLKDEVQRVFANVGKTVEAYERKILCTETRFDRWQRGEVELSGAELDGAATFLRERCQRCHSGPSFSDGKFHDIGVPSTDRGRALGAPALLSDTFNGAGAYSDDRAAGMIKLMFVTSEKAQNGAFRTSSLRGVAQRTFFGHAAHEKTLRGFLLDIYRGRGRRGGRHGGRRDDDRSATVGTLDPLLDDVDVDGDDVDDLIAFLRTLDCPVPATDLLAPR